MSPGDRRPAVLIVVENLSVPMDRRVWQEARALVDGGYDVHVICPQGEQRDRELESELEGVSIHRYPLEWATGGPAGYLREYSCALFHSVRLAWKLSTRTRFDVVHLCNPPDLLFVVGLVLKLRWGTKIVFDHHDLVPELVDSRFPNAPKPLRWGTLFAEWLTFTAADHVLSTNETYREVAVRRGRIDPARVHVVRSAPDPDRFPLVEPDPDLREGFRHLIAYLGVMGPQDGVDYAVRAVERVVRQHGRSDVLAVFIGSGDHREECERLAGELDLGDHVRFTGRISDEMLCRYLSTADVCLAPDPLNPLNNVSTMNKIMEYMAMSRPIVSFDLIEARVSAGDAAVYAAPNDVADFARLICELLDDPDRREEMGRIGRARVTGPLAWDRSVDNLLDAYAHVLRSS